MFTLSKDNPLNLIGLTQSIEPSLLKESCRAALDRYKPSEGAQKPITQLLVEAYRLLEKDPGTLGPAFDPDYGQRLCDALCLVLEKQWKFELRGVWLWVFEQGAELETTLKLCGFKWAAKKGCWVLLPNTEKEVALTQTTVVEGAVDFQS